MKIKANNFFEAIKNNPKEIIEWAQGEIKEYQKLIKLLKIITKGNKHRK